MKVAAVLFSTILAAVSVRAAPQQASTVSSVASSTVSLTPAQTCLAQCSAGDVTCEAACVGTAHPNASQVNATTQCAMACDQGDGSAAATQKYAECQQACIASYFPTSQTVVAVAGSATGTAASNAASATASGASTVSSGAATASATGAPPVQEAPDIHPRLLTSYSV